MEILFTYIIGALAATYLLIAWFHSTLPVHAFHMLRRVGWRHKSPMWEIVPEWDTNFDEMLVALVTYNTPKWMQDLYACKYCLSIHIALWASLAVYFITFLAAIYLPWWFVPAAAFSWPTIMLLIEQFLSFLSK